jgi:hypothetical protein
MQAACNCNTNDVYYNQQYRKVCGYLMNFLPEFIAFFILMLIIIR